MIGLAETLIALRKHRRLSQRELAQKMGVHTNTVVNMEQQPEHVLLGTFSKAAAALDVEEWRILRRVAKSQCSVGMLAATRAGMHDAVDSQRK